MRFVVAHYFDTLDCLGGDGVQIHARLLADEVGGNMPPAPVDEDEQLIGAHAPERGGSDGLRPVSPVNGRLAEGWNEGLKRLGGLRRPWR